MPGVACAAIVSYVGDMPKNTWWIASLLASLMLMGGAAFYAKQQKLELEKTRAQMEELRKTSEETGAQAERLLKGLEESKERIEKLVEEKEAATKAQKDLETQMRSALESKDVTISELQGKLTVNILDRILFDSGEAILKPEGQSVLDQVAKVLVNYPNRQIQVIGHTDNVPIRYNSLNPFKTNWELSAGRAIAAVRYLSEKAGVDARRLGAVGYGEFHPIADNSTAEGRAKNRRIALVVMPEELIPSDFRETQTHTNLTENISTNNPPAETPSTNTNKPEAE
jgi:chemotaxis protein MotB